MFMLAGCGGEDSYTDADGNVDGKLVYEKNCMICHGEHGDEGNSGASDLSKSLMNEEQKVNTIKYGRGDMQPFDYLSEDEIGAVVDYIETLKK